MNDQQTDIRRIIPLKKIRYKGNLLNDENKEKLVKHFIKRNIQISDEKVELFDQKIIELFNTHSKLIEKIDSKDPTKKFSYYDVKLIDFFQSVDAYQQSLIKKEEEPQKPEWKILDPADKNDPVDLETSDYQISENKSFIALGGSVRGKYHAHNALHRDDSFHFYITDQWSIIAVADGAGSCNLSRIGARIAVTNAVKFLQEKLSKYSLYDEEDVSQPLNSELLPLRDFLVDCVIDCRSQLEKNAKEREINVKDLSTTLLISILKPWQDRVLIAGIQVGDGAIAVLSNNAITSLSEGDSGEFAGETTFITSNSIDTILPHKVQFTLKQNFQAIALMTDGVADDFFPTDPAMLKLFESINPLFTKMEDELKPSIIEWLKYERPGSFDDRTLVVLYNKLQNNG